MKKKILSLITAFLAALLLLSAIPAAAVFADDENAVVVVGADLTDEQIDSVYAMFGIERGSLEELTLTNAEERAALQGFVDEKLIGTYSISCVYVRLLPEGSGLSVRTRNITWCTAEYYQNALGTAGITDAEIFVAAPVEVSGTAALAGIYKAYEHLRGRGLNDEAKDAGTQELGVTGEVAEETGQKDAAGIVSELKSLLGETEGMTDDELQQTIRSVAGRYHVTLSDENVARLAELCRSLERLDIEGLQQKAEDARETIEQIEEKKDEIVGFYQKVRSFFESVSDFFARVRSLFG